jgi:two-component system phosphate regulon sensor histidine kinase PhoR
MRPNNSQQVGPVLVVDDEKFFQDLISGILLEEGYEVDIAGSGEEALEACEEGRYTVIVMDLVLPDIIGTEVLARVRERDPDIAVIMITAYASMESAIESLKAGAYDYIKKPIVREDLVHAVERAIERQVLAVQNRELVQQLETRIEELKAMSREKEEVFRILDEGLVIMEENGRIFDLNPKAVEILGPNKTPLAGTVLFDTGFPLPDGFMDTVRESNGLPVRSMVMLPEQGGSRREIELVGLAMRREKGSLRYLLGFRDLTSIRELEKNREEFLAIVSHDLRTPLTSLKGFIEVLVNGDYESESKFREYMGILNSEADRMISLLNDLLDLGRLESGKMELHTEPVSLQDLVTYAMRSMKGLEAQKKVSLVLDPTDGPDLIVEADRRRLLQVMFNLLSNAIKFSPEGGTVEIILRREGNFIFLEVLDEGPGVPTRERSRIFDKYHQTGQISSDRGKGSGLGLAIVKRIIDLHGAVISMEERQEKQGSRFLIRMPAKEEESIP